MANLEKDDKNDNENPGHISDSNKARLRNKINTKPSSGSSNPSSRFNRNGQRDMNAYVIDDEEEDDSVTDNSAASKINQESNDSNNSGSTHREISVEIDYE